MPPEVDTTDPATVPAADPPADPPKPDDEPLGEGGKAALKAERARAAKAEKELKRLQDEAAAREAEAMTESEKAIKAARDEGAKDATTAADKRVIRSEVKALAAKQLNDPADAVAMLDLTQFSVDENGEVDADAITAALDALVAAKPYLAATKPGPGSADGGARTPTADRSVDDAIVAATAAGDIKEAIRLKNVKAASNIK